jgi:hypothetical protein
MVLLTNCQCLLPVRMGRMWAGILVVVVSVVVLGVTVLDAKGTAAASADNQTAAVAYVQLKNFGAKVCLDGGNLLYPLACNEGEHQKWAVSGSGPRKTIQQKATGRCLTSSSKPYLANCRPGDKNQLWKLEANGNGNLVIADNGKCLETDGTSMFLSSSTNCVCNCKHEDYLRWTERQM